MTLIQGESLIIRKSIQDKPILELENKVFKAAIKSNVQRLRENVTIINEVTGNLIKNNKSSNSLLKKKANFLKSNFMDLTIYFRLQWKGSVNREINRNDILQVREKIFFCTFFCCCFFNFILFLNFT